ncbi:MAG: hotdog fold thioesterase [Acidimicrobiia bacterium]|nr:hotdog fold thioesterase [Acidimicrobiia bacterium]
MGERVTFERFDEAWTERVLGKRGRKGIDAYLGVEATEFTAGRLVAGFEVTDELITMIGNMHGGCISALVDHVLGVVMYPIMPEGYWAATTEFKINLLAPVSGGRVEATAQVISMTRRLAVVRVDVENVTREDAGEQRRLVAVAQGTSTIVAPKGA